jgi:hypothetical protein
LSHDAVRAALLVARVWWNGRGAEVAKPLGDPGLEVGVK